MFLLLNIIRYIRVNQKKKMYNRELLSTLLSENISVNILGYIKSILVTNVKYLCSIQAS